MSLPEKVEEFCKEVGKLAIEYDMKNFDLVIQGEGHWDKINVTWNNGHHGSQSNRIVITTKEVKHTTLDGKDFHS